MGIVGKAVRWAMVPSNPEEFNESSTFSLFPSREMMQWDGLRILSKSEFPQFLVLDTGYSEYGNAVMQMLLSDGQVGWAYSSLGGGIEVLP